MDLAQTLPLQEACPDPVPVLHLPPRTVSKQCSAVLAQISTTLPGGFSEITFGLSLPHSLGRHPEARGNVSIIEMPPQHPAQHLAQRQTQIPNEWSYTHPQLPHSTEAREADEMDPETGGYFANPASHSSLHHPAACAPGGLTTTTQPLCSTAAWPGPPGLQSQLSGPAAWTPTRESHCIQISCLGNRSGFQKPPPNAD